MTVPVDEQRLTQLLDEVAAGETSVADAVDSMRGLPYEAVADANVDHHRELRTGHPEAIYGPGKTLTIRSATSRGRSRRAPRARCC